MYLLLLTPKTGSSFKVWLSFLKNMGLIQIPLKSIGILQRTQALIKHDFILFDQIVVHFREHTQIHSPTRAHKSCCYA